MWMKQSILEKHQLHEILFLFSRFQTQKSICHTIGPNILSIINCSHAIVQSLQKNPTIDPLVLNN